ncbi:MAG: hypothetical protein R3335_11185 [Anaerolineales bacterium]|nr:hypothetical protein [Anaerolineales bacterium]
MKQKFRLAIPLAIGMAILLITLAAAQGSQIDRIASQPEQDGANGYYPLFAGRDSPVEPQHLINPHTNEVITAFVGVDAWGAAYDPVNDRVLFNDSNMLYEWPVGGATNLLGTIMESGSPLIVHGLAFYKDTLYATSISTDKIYTIDQVTLVATPYITLTNTSSSISGLAADPHTGQLYGTDDISTNSLVQINLDGSLTVIAPYLAGETDVDGLAISPQGQAYLITDDNTPPYFNVFDFGVMTYTGVITNPFQVSSVQVSGAWINQFPDLIVDPDNIAATHGLPQVTTETLSLNNAGSGLLTWSIVEEADRPTFESSPSGEYVRGTHAPSSGPAPAGEAVPGPAPEAVELPSAVSAYGWNSQHGPYYTRFSLDSPDHLPKTALFNPGGFIGAGTYYNDKVYMIDGANAMWEVDADTGAILNSYAATPPSSGQAYSGLAVDHNTGQAYAVATNVSTSTLLTIDLPTGTAVEVGPINNSPGVIALAADGAGDLFIYDIVTDEFLSVDKNTGAGTVIGPINFDANFGQGMEYDPATDTIYMSAFNNGLFRAELRAVNKATGNTSLLGILGETIPAGLNQIGWLGIGNLCMSTDMPWLSVNPSSGTVFQGGTENVDVVLDSTGLTPGVRTGQLCIDSNDPETPQYRVKVTLTMDQTPVYLPIVIKNAKFAINFKRQEI